MRPVRGRPVHNVNLQTVLSFREIGKGYQSIQLFSTFMNMPPPLSRPAYNRINDILHVTYKEMADKSTSSAAEQIRKASGNINDIQNCQASFDGTWQRRGHASINGVVTAISSFNGKCLDVHVMSKNCSGSMEAAGVKEMFHRSITKNMLRYTEYIGDGDTSSFSVVSDSTPYDGIKIKKLECIGHVQKRLGTRCRNICQKLGGKKLSDQKLINGRGRLTEKAINTLQNYYGMAIRQNVSNIYQMKKCV